MTSFLVGLNTSDSIQYREVLVVKCGQQTIFEVKMCIRIPDLK